jgi:hypothetical protein
MWVEVNPITSKQDPMNVSVLSSMDLLRLMISPKIVLVVWQ